MRTCCLLRSPRHGTRGLVIPIVYNTSGYERASAVAALGDLVYVWLTDFKYADAGLAQSLSHIKDYPRVAVSGLAQDGARSIAAGELVDEGGPMKRGIIVRHLVLLGHADDSCRVLAWCGRRWATCRSRS